MNDSNRNPALQLWASSVLRAIEENREVTFPIPQGLMPWMDRFESLPGESYYDQLVYLELAKTWLAQNPASGVGGSEKSWSAPEDFQDVIQKVYVLFALLHPLWKEIVYVPKLAHKVRAKRVSVTDIQIGQVWWLTVPFQTGPKSTYLKNQPFAVLDVIEYSRFWLVAVACRTSLKSEHSERGLTLSHRYYVSEAGCFPGLDRAGLFDLDQLGHVALNQDLPDYLSEFDFGKHCGKLPRAIARDLTDRYVERQVEKRRGIGGMAESKSHLCISSFDAL